MKKYLLASALLATIFTYGQMGQLPATRTKVIILGVFHFVSNNDAIKFTRENMLSEKRQKEIDDLNESLAKFQPSKIFIEWRPANQPYVDSSYNEYKKGNFILTGNEVHQIGFKLARKLNHPTVYCMDAPGVYLFDTVMKTAKKYGQDENLNQYFSKMREKALRDDSLQKLLTIKARLRIVNKKENIMETYRGNAGVNSAAYIGQVGDYAAAEFMGEWYKRNIRMYSNIVRSLSTTDTAILIIVGAGHARIIEHCFEGNPAFEVIDPGKYLK